jgi:hypothetical protein
MYLICSTIFFFFSKFAHLLLNVEVFHGRLIASPLGGSSALIVGVVVLTSLRNRIGRSSLFIAMLMKIDRMLRAAIT